jgi:glycosyltransferase involved in cell wall biosynthesis
MNAASSLFFSLISLFWSFDLVILSVPPFDTALGFHLGVLLQRFLRGKQTKVVYDYRDDILDMSRHKLIARGAFWIDRYLARFLLRVMYIVLARSDLVVCVSEGLRRMMIQRGFIASNIIVVPNGADTRLFRPADEAEKTATRSEYGVPVDSFVLAVVSEAGWIYHRLDTILLALHALEETPANRIDNLVLLVVGRRTRELNSYLEFAEKLGVRSRVIYLGEIAHDRMPKVLNMTDVGVVPLSDHDFLRHALPVKFFEYCSCGLPVIVTAPRDSLIEYLVQKNSLGLVCGARDAKALAAAIRRLYSDSKLRAEAGARCRAMIEHEFDRAILSEIYASAVEGILTRHPERIAS